MRKAAGQRWFHWMGTLLAVAAIVFLLVRFNQYAGQIAADDLVNALPRVVAASFGYFLCGLPLAIIWWLTVRCAGEARPEAAVCMLAYMASQLGKYVPGNVMHFAARHWLMRQHGCAHSALIGAGLLEALVLVIAAIMLGAAVLGPSAEILLEWTVPGWVTVLGPILAIVLASVGWLGARRRGWIDDSIPVGRAVTRLIAALAAALVFFVGMNACFVLVSGSLGWSQWSLVLPWIAVSWLLGFLVPGAPGGIGVREVVLVFGLAPLMGEVSALLSAALFRLTTVSGDSFMALAGAFGLRWRGASGH